MSQIMFTADEHYGHANIIKFCNRPFDNVQEMNKKLIENHNAVVSKDDIVYHLGDAFWKSTNLKEALDIRYQLNGQHYYILGNHEERMRDLPLRNSFGWVKDMENLRIQGYPNIVLCHYAMRTFNGSHRGAWNLYGHSHGELPEDELVFSFDVGVDTHDYFPWSLEQVKEKMIRKGWGS